MAERPAPLVLVVDPGALPDPEIPFGSYAAVGVAGAIVCVAAHFRAGKAAKSRLIKTDGLVERLEKLPCATKT